MAINIMVSQMLRGQRGIACLLRAELPGCPIGDPDIRSEFMVDHIKANPRASTCLLRFFPHPSILKFLKNSKLNSYIPRDCRNRAKVVPGFPNFTAWTPMCPGPSGIAMQ